MEPLPREPAPRAHVPCQLYRPLRGAAVGRKTAAGLLFADSAGGADGAGSTGTSQASCGPDPMPIRAAVHLHFPLISTPPRRLPPSPAPPRTAAVSDVAIGLCAGLITALLSSLSYLVSRHHSLSVGGSRLRLLGLSHALMAGVSLPLALLLSPEHLPPLKSYYLPLLASAGFYLLGQCALALLLRRSDASRIAPLLGLKIVMLAGITSFLLGEPLDFWQWAAVGLGTVAALALQTGAGGIAGGELPLVLLTCLTFSLSDLAILALIKALVVPVEGFPPLGRIHAGGLAMTITYAACGAVALPLVGCYRPRHRGDWIAAGQYAAAWLGSMAALYICFGQIGVVFGNILQSTRGFMSVVLGAVLAHLGWHELEQRVDRATLLKRMAAAALMTAAIALYAIDLR